MTKKKTTTTSKKPVAEKPVTELEVKVETSKETDQELVMEAQIEEKPAKEEPKKEEPKFVSSECVLTNTSQNTICLFDGSKEESITVAPREIKRVSRDGLKRLMKNPMIRSFFDKGILTTNIDAEDTSAHEAVIPNELKNPVERHEDGQNVVAQVKKFKKEGSINIEL